jgi:hypothetical protein
VGGGFFMEIWYDSRVSVTCLFGQDVYLEILNGVYFKKKEKRAPPTGTLREIKVWNT